ncbi:MAG: hypothetical protein PVJ86_05815 [Phycisphaerales bacterium]
MSNIKYQECRIPARRHDLLNFVFCILIIAFLSQAVYACSTPVFRYALERWPADFYEAVLIHRGPIADDDPTALLLKDETAQFLNLRLSAIDLESAAETETGPEPAERVKSLLGGEIPEKLPALALWYPWQRGRAAPLWVGEFTPATVALLAKSPKRKELAERLMEGQSGVWVFVESGNADKDRAALQLLSQELEAATRELKEMALPVDDVQMPGLSFEFSTLSVSRSDPKERFLLEMLLNSEPDLDEYADVPIVFPVFGRGRALFALVGEGINSDNLREAIAFLTGPCGCEIKMMNPGVDLLMATNWDAAVMQFYQEFYETQEEELPELTSVFPEEPPIDSRAAAGAFAETSAQGKEGSAAPPAEPSQDTDVNSTLETSGLGPKGSVPVEEQASSIEDQGSGLGVIGTTAVSVGAILVIAALGTFAVMRRHP